MCLDKKPIFQFNVLKQKKRKSSKKPLYDLIENLVQKSQILVSTTYAKYLQLDLTYRASELAGYIRQIPIVFGFLFSPKLSDATSIASRSVYTTKGLISVFSQFS